MLRLSHPFPFAFLLLAAAVGLRAAESPPPRLRVALVIDDGPDPAQCEKILAVLAQEHVRVTFSQIGRNVAAHPDLARAEVAAGHEINNHSYTHPHFKQLDDAAIAHEVSQAQAAIRQATGVSPRWCWTPFLEADDRIAAAIRTAGVELYPLARFHFIDSRDWAPETTAAIVRQRATTGVTDGTVILCHEWPPHTLAELPAIIAELKRQGAVFVTFSELADGGP